MRRTRQIGAVLLLTTHPVGVPALLQSAHGAGCPPMCWRTSIWPGKVHDAFPRAPRECQPPHGQETGIAVKLTSFDGLPRVTWARNARSASWSRKGRHTRARQRQRELEPAPHDRHRKPLATGSTHTSQSSTSNESLLSVSIASIFQGRRVCHPTGSSSELASPGDCSAASTAMGTGTVLPSGRGTAIHRFFEL